MKLIIRLHQTIKPLSASLLILAPLTALAAEVAAPGAGSMLQQLQTAAPSSKGTELTIERKGSGNRPPSAPFAVQKVLISATKTSIRPPCTRWWRMPKEKASPCPI